MNGPPRLTAERTRKVRWPIRCGLCGGQAQTGERVGYIGSDHLDPAMAVGWCHVGCINAYNQQLARRWAREQLGAS